MSVETLLIDPTITIKARASLPLVNSALMNMNELVGDEQLLWRVVQGEKAAFKKLYDRYSPRVMGLSLRITGDRALAEEVTQETFWRVWRNAASFNQARGSYQNWMFGIARNLAIDIVRRQKMQLEPLHDGSDTEETSARRLAAADDVPEAAWTSLQQKQVQLALAELPPEQRDVIEWIYFQGKTRREIAEGKNIPFGTINTRARLALDKLRRVLQANGYGLEEL